MTYVIQVNKNDQYEGLIEKIEAHKKGILHRAVSVIIFNTNGDMLLQQRAIDKYHSGGLWSNAACTHPLPEESCKQASTRRLHEEMGIKAHLSHLYSFIYKVELDNNMIEHEYDHVYTGVSDEKPVFNINEVCNYKYLSIKKIQEEIITRPEQYSAWFKLIFAKLIELKQDLKTV